MPKRVVILQHVASEKAGTLLDYLEKNKIPFEAVNLYEKGHVLPPLASVRALIVMGGPMNVYEEDQFPFLIEENRYIQEALKKKIPYLGICLGSQLLAKALGAKVYKATQEEIGWQEVNLLPESAKDSVFSCLDSKKLKVLQWHGDTFDLPKGAAHLASSSPVPNQAYALDGLFYGLQFHVEVNRVMLENWFKERKDLGQILFEYDNYRPNLDAICDRLYHRFFGLRTV